jgi:NADPH:quinone reductase-like Zn-dependent oxidoreductase
MQAVRIHETGGPEVLSVEEVDTPEPGDGELLIRVHAASVNPVDWKYQRGHAETDLPIAPGRDVAGTVEASRVDAFAEGDAVLASVPRGGYAEYAVASALATALKPDALTWKQAAALPVTGMTAWQALFDRGGLEAGQTVLIAGAAGGVGHLAVQFAKVAGARVIGTGSSRNRDYVLGLGAAQYVDYTEQDVAETVSDVDLALDTVGGGTTEQLVATVRAGGVLVTIANAPPEESARARGVRAELLVMSPDAEQLARIARLVADGEVTLEIAEVLPFSDAKRAHELSESGHVRGKLVLTVP